METDNIDVPLLGPEKLTHELDKHALRNTYKGVAEAGRGALLAGLGTGASLYLYESGTLPAEYAAILAAVSIAAGSIPMILGSNRYNVGKKIKRYVDKYGEKIRKRKLTRAESHEISRDLEEGLLYDASGIYKGVSGATQFTIGSPFLLPIDTGLGEAYEAYNMLLTHDLLSQTREYINNFEESSRKETSQKLDLKETYQNLKSKSKYETVSGASEIVVGGAAGLFGAGAIHALNSLFNEAYSSSNIQTAIMENHEAITHNFQFIPETPAYLLLAALSIPVIADGLNRIRKSGRFDKAAKYLDKENPSKEDLKSAKDNLAIGEAYKAATLLESGLPNLLPSYDSYRRIDNIQFVEELSKEIDKELSVNNK